MIISRRAAATLLLATAGCARQPSAEAQPTATGGARSLSIGPDGLTQGGLALGQVAPGSRVTLDGKPVRVAPDGRFVIGFARDAGPVARLAASGPGGSETRELAIAKREWDIQRLNGLPAAMVSPNAQQLARIQAEQKRINAARADDSEMPYFAEPFAWPARGRISGVYGSQRILNGEPRAAHLGLDIATPSGTPCAAMGGGRVVLAADLYFTGNTVIIQHGHGLTSLYAHLSAIDVAEGATMEQGQRIGATGATGRVTGPHLHLGVSWFSTAVDPRPLLPAA
jgi:murein DD-endopeptidase MepM/ murein hydrolase activator NlpD